MKNLDGSEGDTLTESDWEGFTNDLISVFEKHHIAILWELSQLVRINSDAHVNYLARYQNESGKELVVPMLSRVNLDELINLENDNDELSES